MRFKEIFDDYTNEVRSRGGGTLTEESFLHWTDNYVNQSREVFNPYDFITGKIYSFEYKTELRPKEKYTNSRPLVFLTGFPESINKIFSGIDLVLIDPSTRMYFLDRIVSVYHTQIEENKKRSEDGIFTDQIPLKTDFETFDNIMKGIPFKNAYRAWDIRKIRDVYEIPFDDWAKIVYLHTRSIEGTPIEEIYKQNIIK
jgi:hypothetical protein